MVSELWQRMESKGWVMAGLLCLFIAKPMSTCQVMESCSTCHVPSTSLMIRLSSWKPAIRSASLLPRAEDCELNVGLDLRKPRFLASAESLAFRVWAEDAQREFLRIADVTARISEYKTCFCDTDPVALAALFVESMELSWQQTRRDLYLECHGELKQETRSARCAVKGNRTDTTNQFKFSRAPALLIYICNSRKKGDTC